MSNHCDPLNEISRALAHARYELPELYGEQGMDPKDCQLIYFQQAWPNTTCGWGGVGGQAITTAGVVVLTSPIGGVAVYHGGRFAYFVERPTEEFWMDVRRFSMLGATGLRWKKRYESSPTESDVLR